MAFKNFCPAEGLSKIFFPAEGPPKFFFSISSGPPPRPLMVIPLCFQTPHCGDPARYNQWGSVGVRGYMYLKVALGVGGAQ